MTTPLDRNKEHTRAGRYVDSAIDEVIAAEQRLADAVRECEARAEAIVSEARRKVRIIEENSERRIAAIRHRSQTVVYGDEESRPGSSDMDADSRAAKLEAAVHKLAERLAGPETNGEHM